MIFSTFYAGFARALLTGIMLLLMFSVLGAESSVTVKEVLTSKSLLLEGGTVVRLAGIQTPNPGEPQADESMKALEAMVKGQQVRLKSPKDAIDRHGRLVAQVYLEDGSWVQGELLKQGRAMVYSFPDQREHAREMLAFERAARAAGRGIWAEEYYRVIAPEEAGKFFGRFKIVQGKVQDVAERRNGMYINFGEDWRTDFTLFIARGDLRRFKGMDILSLKGKTIRARGWVESRNGPFLALSHPEQVELER